MTSNNKMSQHAKSGRNNIQLGNEKCVFMQLKLGGYAINVTYIDSENIFDNCKET